jgi:hypothetical protein
MRFSSAEWTPAVGLVAWLLGRLRALDGFVNELMRLGRITPADDLHPLAGLQILVVLEEVADLV